MYVYIYIYIYISYKIKHIIELLLLLLLYKINFYCVYGNFFFLLSHFLVVEDYELSKSTSHVLSVPLTLECVRILS